MNKRMINTIFALIMISSVLEIRPIKFLHMISCGALGWLFGNAAEHYTFNKKWLELKKQYFSYAHDQSVYKKLIAIKAYQFDQVHKKNSIPNQKIMLKSLLTCIENGNKSFNKNNTNAQTNNTVTMPIQEKYILIDECVSAVNTLYKKR